MAFRPSWLWVKLVASPGFSFFHIQSLILDSGELFVPHDHLVLQLPFIIRIDYMLGALLGVLPAFNLLSSQHPCDWVWCCHLVSR